MNRIRAHQGSHVLLTTTRWPEAHANLDALEFDSFVEYIVFTQALTLFIGFVTFIVMGKSGQLSHRLFNNFARGYYGAYAALAMLMVLLIIGTMFGAVPKVITLR